MTYPRISIITVCYNSVATIEETIRSILSQDYPNIEYIIVDGLSTDGTLSVIQKYKDKISAVYCEKDKGVYDAMNKGIAKASGEIIGLLNSDDVYAHSSVISEVAQQFMQYPIDACYGDLIYFSSHRPDRIYRYWRSGQFSFGMFAKGWSPPHPTFFVKKSIYERYGNFNLNYSMGNDIELMMRFLEKHRIACAYLPEVLVKMRLGGISNQGMKAIIEQNKNILKAAKNLNIPISPMFFLIRKILNRLSQLILKPRSKKVLC